MRGSSGVTTPGAKADIGEYLHWDKLRHLTPPDGLSIEEWWALIKLRRRQALRPLPLADAEGRPFTCGTPDGVLRLLHFTDQRCGREIAMPAVLTTDDQARSHYLVNPLTPSTIARTAASSTPRRPRNSSPSACARCASSPVSPWTPSGSSIPSSARSCCTCGSPTTIPSRTQYGRTARALFYWYMRTRGYWLVEYLSISRILADAPAQYAKAFLLTETDELDATYFLLYHLNVIKRAVTELHGYLDRKVDERRAIERLMRCGSAGFNHRQPALLSHAVRNPGHGYTFGSHAASHAVTHETARNDILPLVERNLLIRARARRRYVFTAPANLKAVLPDVA